VKVYVLIMACHSDRARTLSSGDPAPAGSPRGGVKPPLHLPLRADLHKGRLKVELAWVRMPSTDRQSASLGSPESGAGREGLGTGGWGLGARLSMASCVPASSSLGIVDRGLGSSRRSTAGYCKPNNIYINIHTKLNPPRFCKTKPLTPLESTYFSAKRT
jgi:hypothetical protein